MNVLDFESITSEIVFHKSLLTSKSLLKTQERLEYEKNIFFVNCLCIIDDSNHAGNAGEC